MKSMYKEQLHASKNVFCMKKFTYSYKYLLGLGLRALFIKHR